jgi:hypothetical protein
MKQETLEEASERLYPICIKPILDKYDDGVTNIIGEEDINEDCKNAFYEGAKWQQQQMYSEEEVLEIIRQYALEEHLITSSKPDIWFKQFKNK